MTSSKVILVTGASRGIGYAIARHLIQGPEQHKVVISARTRSPLEELQRTAPDRVEISTGDLAEPGTAERAIEDAVRKFGGLDAVVLNHGILGDARKVADGGVEAWKRAFDVNFFSLVAAVQAAIPHLRKSHGTIIMTSSGAAVSAYQAWGAYGATKAAVNHLALTLAVEEPDVTTIAIRPGVVDSEMQRDIREKLGGYMNRKDHEKFVNSHKEGKLLRPEQPGNVMAKLAVGADKSLSGKFLSWDDDKFLAQYQDSKRKATGSR